MDFLDFIKKAMTVKGVNLMLNNGKKKKTTIGMILLHGEGKSTKRTTNTNTLTVMIFD